MTAEWIDSFHSPIALQAIKFFNNALLLKVTIEDPLPAFLQTMKDRRLSKKTPFVKKQGWMIPNSRKSRAIWYPSNDCLRCEEGDKFIPPTA